MRNIQPIRGISTCIVLARCFLLSAVVFAPLACGESAPPAPLAHKAEPLELTAKATASTLAFEVVPGSADASFVMEAPFEKIVGKVPPEAVSGNIHIDPRDLGRSNGLIRVDLSGLELHQSKATEEGQYGESSKNALQNEHVRAWLEIGPDAPEAERQKNASVELLVTSITNPSVVDLSSAHGANRTVQFTGAGELRLHQRKRPVTVELEAVFRYQGDQLTGVDVRTRAPFAISLAEHDVRPREGFGKLAQKTLEALAPKVARDAMISIRFTAGAAGRPSEPLAGASAVPPSTP